MRRNLIVAALMLIAPLAWAGDGDVERGYLGVSLQFTESVHRDGEPVDDNVGIFVAGVMTGGPAELAGLREDDKIVAVEGREISDMGDLKRAMQPTRRGDRVSVTVERDDREQTFDVVLGEMPEKYTKVERFGVMVEHAKNRAFVGIESQPVEAQLAEYFGVEGGILVTRVVEDTPADRAGIEAGDVIVAWGETPLRDQNDIHEMISRSKPGDGIELSVTRRGVESQTFLTLDSAADHMKKRELLHGDELHKEKLHQEKLHYKVRIKETKHGE